jgi:hypothetical protein
VRAALVKAGVAIVLLAGAFVAAPGASGRQAQQLPGDPLTRLRTYLVAYQAQLSSLVAEEHYVQNYPGRSKRTTRADLVMVRLPGNAGWIAFRDVFEVDQRSIRDREDRLLKLLQTPTRDALTQARRIGEEGARFNLGPSRTINVPDVALAYLHPSHRDQVTVEPPRPTTIDGAEALLFRFRETDGPTIVIGPSGRDVPAQGRVWTDAATGAILRTELTIKTQSSIAVCVVDFQLDERIGWRVPSRMSERYTMGNLVVTATATYGNFRQFKVSTAEVVGKPPGF